MAIAHEIAAVKRSASKREKALVETIGTASIGDVVRQGDLYLVCVEIDRPGMPAKTNQLAPGETQGSRHIATGECVVYQPDDLYAEIVNRSVKGVDIPRELVGPVIQCVGQTTITHPEHGHKVLPADSTWAVVYQRAYADEIRRVQD